MARAARTLRRLGTARRAATLPPTPAPDARTTGRVRPALLASPVVHPAVVQHRLDAACLQHFDSGRVAVRLAIEHVRHPRVDDELGAHHAGGRAYEDDLVAQVARGFDQGVHLGMNAATAPGHGGVALVGEAARIAVVAD